METKKTSGRPALVKNAAGVEIKLPPGIPKEVAEELPTIPASLNEVGGIKWIELWLTCKDYITDKDKYIAEILCLNYQNWQELLTIKNINNVPPLFTHTNKSKTMHPLWKMISDAEKDYKNTLKEMGLTPASFAAISKLEKIDNDDPIMKTISEIRDMNMQRLETVKELIEGDED